jgi:hypothetical protein
MGAAARLGSRLAFHHDAADLAGLGFALHRVPLPSSTKERKVSRIYWISNL